GRKRQIEFPATRKMFVLAKRILSHGWRFEAEVLSTGEVSFTVFDPVEEIDVAIELSANGPEVTGAMKRLVESACKLLEIANA
ncbi:MAG TPA: hypothetical protein VM223_04770, partial [Planctomycetota bacterium]|nr:hypothetical protein [Planctomycetota bacterium]